MDKISEKLNIIKNSKDDIKTAIENKGVTVGNVGIESYADKINQIVGEEVTKPEQEKSINPSTEKQIVLPDTGYTLSKVEVEAIPTETKTISNVDFSTGNMIVAPTEGKYITSVEVTKPTTLIAENVKKDVNIAGIVGTLESGGGNDFEINDCSYLFNNGARMDIFDKILKLCKNVISTSYMFGGSNANYETLDLSNFDTSNVTDMSYMFYYNGKLKNANLSNFDTSKVKNMSYMFSYSGLQSLDLSSFDMSSVTSITYMFQTCQSLTSLILGNFDTSKINSMTGTFYYLSKLKDLQEIDLSGCRDVLNIMKGCSSLENFGGFKNYGKSFNAKQSNVYNYKLELNTLTNLTHDSLMNVINKLYDLNLTYNVANGGTLYTQQLVIGADNIAKLTSEELSIATNKGWVVS